MKNFLILIGVVFILSLILSHVIYVLTWERWAVILLVSALFFKFRKKSKSHRR
jgi:predicted membrane protein